MKILTIVGPYNNPKRRTVHAIREEDCEEIRMSYVQGDSLRLFQSVIHSLLKTDNNTTFEIIRLHYGVPHFLSIL
jgi:hypothetical protein